MSDTTPARDVAGEYLGHSYTSGCFVYRYTCPKCGRTHKSSAPTLTEPTLCHTCYRGGADRVTRFSGPRYRKDGRVEKKPKKVKHD